uniref:Uncharacterized protein n=1 Tax=Sphaerodactylus townsendi TaxID=933632 RepID=A0ACB8FHZ6_9SAUR
MHACVLFPAFPPWLLYAYVYPPFVFFSVCLISPRSSLCVLWPLSVVFSVCIVFPFQPLVIIVYPSLGFFCVCVLTFPISLPCLCVCVSGFPSLPRRLLMLFNPKNPSFHES